MIEFMLVVLFFGLVGLLMRNSKQLKEADSALLVAQNRIYALEKQLRDA